MIAVICKQVVRDTASGGSEIRSSVRSSENMFEDEDEEEDEGDARNPFWIPPVRWGMLRRHVRHRQTADCDRRRQAYPLAEVSLTSPN